MVRYEIDTKNSELVSIAKETHKDLVPSIRNYLKNLAINLPIDHIYSKVSSDPLSIEQSEVEFKFTEEQIKEIEALKKWNT